jgi:hypothetical protein
VFDPLGLATPITAGFKLDLHQLCELELDWDDKVPEELLDKWVGNMEQIQALRGVTFQRTVIPVDAVNTQIELLVHTNASQNLGVVAIFGRVLRKNGLYSCQLLTGRSKLLTGMTIPKAAVTGATTAAMVRRNLISETGTAELPSALTLPSVSTGSHRMTARSKRGSGTRSRRSGDSPTPRTGSTSLLRRTSPTSERGRHWWPRSRRDRPGRSANHG